MCLLLFSNNGRKPHNYGCINLTCFVVLKKAQSTCLMTIKLAMYFELLVSHTMHNFFLHYPDVMHTQSMNILNSMTVNGAILVIRLC